MEKKKKKPYSIQFLAPPRFLKKLYLIHISQLFVHMDTILLWCFFCFFSSIPSYDLLATELNGAIYLLGGKALRLDVDTDEWTVLEEEFLDRKFFTGCSTVNGQIYLISERKINKVSTNMVLLDLYTDTCIEMNDAIPCPVPIRGCVTVRLMDR